MSTDTRLCTTSRLVRAWIKNTLAVVVFSVVLFASAGTFAWPMGWAYVVLMVLGTIVGTWAIGPDLLLERMERQQGYKRGDLALALMMARVGPLAITIVAGLDHRYQWTNLSPALSALGIVLVLIGSALPYWAMATNRFFSAVVRIQSDRGHTVIDSGPYAFLRHPGYAGSIAHNMGTPLMLGSVWALIPAVLNVAVTAVRTAREDRFLQQALHGYDEYAKRVRFRLLPGVW